jgi:hypothetical protein
LKEGIKTLNDFYYQLFGGQCIEDAAEQTATLSLEFPGVKTPGITIFDEKRFIQIRGERKDTGARVNSSVRRSLNMATISAHMSDGILKLVASISFEGRVLELDSTNRAKGALLVL